MVDFLTKRDGWWHYARRVPFDLAALDGRVIVRQSTKVRVADDPKGAVAAKVANRINAATEAFWRSLAAGEETADAAERYEDARRRARQFGFDYVPVEQLAGRPIAELLERLRALEDAGATTDGVSAPAVLGTERPPPLLLSGLFDAFERLMRAANKDLSPDQVRKWKNPKLRAVANLIEAIGDKPLADVSRDDALTFRDVWQARILKDDVEIATANKDFSHLNKMVNTVIEANRLGFASPFAKLMIGGETIDSRAAFTADFVQGKLLADRALAGLNAEARHVLYLMAETGLRLSEAVNLSAQTIDLSAPIPHVTVAAEGRRMKTKQSARTLPLVGVALEAMRLHPDGFPRYRDKAGGLSATINKFLLENDLRPTSEHSAYSLRHTFEDRLTAVEAPEKLIAAMMGHKYSRPKYGSGPSLEQKREWLLKIAFTPPGTL